MVSDPLLVLPDQFNQVQLLQVEEQVSVIVQQLRMQLVDQVSCLLDPSILNCVTNQNSVFKGEQFDGWLDSCFLLELLGSLLESLWKWLIIGL